MKISFIGGGNMARAIIGGLKNNGFDASAITVVEQDAEKRLQLKEDYAVHSTDNNVDIGNTDVIVLAIKPQQLKAVCQQLIPYIKNQLIISIAAGIRINDIANWLNQYPAIVRVMPNTPAQIQAGVSALYALETVNTAQRQQATTILAAVGKTLWLDNEAKMDAVTAISGSGPAYVFYLIEALQEAGVSLGLMADEAAMLALETFNGASQLAVKSMDNVKTLRDQVTSKGGTTEQGILALENANVKSIMQKAAQAAADKSKSLGDALSK